MILYVPFSCFVIVKIAAESDVQIGEIGTNSYSIIL